MNPLEQAPQPQPQHQQWTYGLQWRLAGVYLAVSVLSVGLVVLGHYLATQAGLPPASAWGAGIAAGLAAGLAGSAYGFYSARQIKLRLWDASEMARRISRGDLTARVNVVAPDEIGLLEEQLSQMAGHLETAVGELRRLAEQNRLLLEEAGRGAALEERARLARDLHDTVNQQLFVLTMRTAAVRRRLEKIGGEAAELTPELSALEELARQAHGEARTLILQLRPTTLEQQGLGPALAEYVKAVGVKEGWEVVPTIDSEIRIRGKRAEAMFRVAQEALNNVTKHARAHKIWAGLVRTADGEAGTVRLTIRDNGEGFDAKSGVRPTAVGLVGMQERVGALGGTLVIRSAPGKGTEVVAVIPLTEGGDGAT